MSTTSESEDIQSTARRNIDIESDGEIETCEKSRNEIDEEVNIESRDNLKEIRNNAERGFVSDVCTASPTKESDNTGYILVKKKVNLDEGSSQELAVSHVVSSSESSIHDVESHEQEEILEEASSNVPAASTSDENNDDNVSEANDENENHVDIENNDTIDENNGSETINENQNGNIGNNSTNNDQNNDTEDANQNNNARNRWLRINQQFQILVTLVTLVFSILIFCILVCWVIFTSAYVMSMELECDVPLKLYFWLATFHLILELFRTDIMQYLLRWDSRSSYPVPGRVVFYNLCYVVYAMVVLRLGIKSVFPSSNSTCSQTAPELYQTAAVFISLSIGAWCTILFGYILPFICVIIVLTRNGYSPTTDLGAFFATGSAGAPEGTIDLLKEVSLEDITETECCICIDNFESTDTIVMTECKHVFHKKCLQEWLQHSRTCAVCRTDIPAALAQRSNINTTDNVVDIEGGRL